MLAGFDIGGTNARCLLVDDDGSVVANVRRSSAGSGPELVQSIVALVRELEAANGVKVEAIGLGVAGLAHRSGTIRYSPNLPDLLEFPLGQEVESVLGVPVLVANDANAGAWAEGRIGAGRGIDDFVFVALGTGIGIGVVANGTLVAGANGFGGEAGHMVIDADGPRHVTGQRGPWEYFASGTALGRLGREAAARGSFPRGVELAGSVADITGFHVTEALRSADPDASVVFDEFCREVARGIANLVLILDPERIVLGGGVSAVGEPLRDGVQLWLGRLLLGADHRPTAEVVLAELGPDAGALGAALLAADLIS